LGEGSLVWCSAGRSTEPGDPATRTVDRLSIAYRCQQGASNAMRSDAVHLGVSVPLYFSQVFAKYLAKQMSQDNITIRLMKRVAEDFARPFGVSPQPRHITGSLHSIFVTPTTSSPLNEINNVYMGPSNGLFVK
jgi:hypothetical protein